jgi:steroid delta-isomerase-like uncharacterized protein
MTFNLGQGASAALKDGVVLASALAAERDVFAALRAYEDERRPVTNHQIEQSWSIGSMTTWEGRIGYRAHYAVLRLTKPLVTKELDADYAPAQERLARVDRERVMRPQEEVMSHSAAESVRETTPEENKELIRHAIDEVLNKGNLALVDETYSADLITHRPGLPEPIRGRQGYKDYITSLRTGFPDLRFEIEDMLAERDKVMVQWTLRGTQTGELVGLPPTGKRVTEHGVLAFRMSGGKVAEIWLVLNEMEILQQLGVIPASGGTIPKPLVLMLKLKTRLGR